MRWLKHTDSLSKILMPRNLQSFGGQSSLVNNLTRASIPRTKRLLLSLDELEREVRDSMTIQGFEYKCKSLSLQFSYPEQSVSRSFFSGTTC